jgi:hypothetical protein
VLRLCPYVLWRRVRAGCTVSECVMCTVTAISDSASLPIHNIYINTRHTSGEMIISIIADAPDQDRRLITIWRFLPCSGSFFFLPARATSKREKWYTPCAEMVESPSVRAKTMASLKIYAAHAKTRLTCRCSIIAAKCAQATDDRTHQNLFTPSCNGMGLFLV